MFKSYDSNIERQVVDMLFKKLFFWRRKRSGLFEQYKRAGKKFWVRKDLKGKDVELSLCYKCKKYDFYREKNCPTQNALQFLSIAQDIKLAVWECRFFDEKEKK